MDKKDKAAKKLNLAKTTLMKVKSQVKAGQVFTVDPPTRQH
jgi:hypothetical protein